MNSIFSKKTKEESTTYDTISSLSHKKWNCKYHIVFVPIYSVASIMRYLKGKSSLMIFERYANRKYK